MPGSALAEATLLVDSRCELGECVLWDDRRATLFWTDITGQRLWMHQPASGRTRRWRVPQRLGCLGLCDDGRLLLGLAKGLALADFEPLYDAGDDDAPPLRWIVDVERDSRDTRINDGRCDRDGNFVFGTKDEGHGAPRGRFYQFSFAHGLRDLGLPPAAIPNSICFGLDGRTLYFCDSANPRIMRCGYDAGRASVHDVREFARVPAGAAPDGSVVDAEGNVWNAHWGAGRVQRVRADGRIDGTVAVPVKNPSCCTWGGTGFDVLYVSTAREDMDAAELAATPHAGGLYAASIPGVRGLPESRVATRP